MLDEKQHTQYIMDVFGYYLWTVPFVLNVTLMLFSDECQSLIIALCCFIVALRRINCIPNFKWKNHIFFFNLRKEIMNKKLFFMRLNLFFVAVGIIYMAIISESVSFVCGAYCLNSETVYQIFHGMSYSGGLYMLILSILSSNNCQKMI